MESAINILLNIGVTLYEASDFDDLCKIMLSLMKKTSNNNLIGGKIGIYDKEIDEYRIYYESSSVENITSTVKQIRDLVNSTCHYNEIKFFSRIVADTRQKLIIQDNHSELSLKIHPAQGHFEPHAMIWVPLLYKNEFLGIISFSSKPINSFTEELIQIIEGIAKITSVKVYQLLTTKKLKKNDEKFRSILSSVDDTIYIMDKEGRITEAYNSNLGDIYFNQSFLIGQLFTTLNLPEDLKNNINYAYQKLKQYNFIHQFDYSLKKNQMTRWFNAKISRYNDAHSKFNGIVVVSREITKRKQLEQTIIESEEQFRTLYENVTIGIYRTTPEGEIILANPALINMLGYTSPDELKQRNLEKDGFFTDNPRKNFLDMIMKTGEIRGMESVWQKQDGTKIYIRESAKIIRDKKGEILYFEGTVEDISEQKLIYEVLQESEKNFRILFNENPIPTVITENPFDSFILANKAFLAAFKLSEETLTGKKNINLGLQINLDDQLIIKNKIAKVGYLDNFEISYINSEGNKGTYLISIRIFQMYNINYYLTSLLDITDRKKSEDAVIKSEERYRRIVNTTTEGIIILDINKMMTFVNKQMCFLTGFSEEELLGHEFEEFIFLEDREDHFNQLNLRKTGISSQYERRMRHKNGQPIWFMVSATPLYNDNGEFQGSFGMFADITLRKESEKKLLLAQYSLDHAPDIICWNNIDAGFFYINKAAENILGYSKEEFTKLTFKNIDEHISDADWVNLWNDVKDKKSLIIESIFKKKDRTLIPVEIRLNYLKYDGSEYLFSLVHNISERKYMEEAIKKSEEKLRSFIEQSSDGFMFSDENLNVVEWNKTMQIISGLTREEVINKPFYEIQLLLSPELQRTPESLDYYKNILFKIIRSGDSKPIEKPIETFIQRADGSLRFIQQTIFLIKTDRGFRIGGITRDISEKKLSDEALRRSELNFRELFDNAPVGYHEINIDGKIIRINQTELDMLGYSKDEMIDHHIWEFVLEKEITINSIKSKITGNEIESGSYERTYIRKDGIGIQVLIEDVFLRNDINEIIGIRSTIQDISNRIRNELELQESNRLLEETLTELRETQKQVLQQERLRALGQLASGIAHDINNSLSPILGYSDLLLRKKEIVKLAEKQLKMIRTASLDIKRTINSMKEFYRPKEDNEMTEHINLNKTVESTLELTKHRWKDISESKGIVINITKNFQDNLPIITGNESEIREALTNLILNSSDAMPIGGEISITTFQKESEIILEIKDTGVGMDDETLQRCFEPFYTTKGETGTGLGLSMVYGIINRHDGKIKVQSEKHKGTKISLCFPVKIIIEKKPEEKTEIFTLPRLKILCIDDDQNIRQMLFDMLNPGNHKICLADSGNSGIETFLSAMDEKEPFDIVITDLGMPYMNGKTIAYEIKMQNPETPVILMTGWGSFLDDDNASIIDYILKKPITIDELMKGLRVVLNIKMKT